MTPSVAATLAMGRGSSSVVICVISARFFTSPHDSPSGVSAGHSMPHCDGCRARGPLTFRLFSNCDMIRVIMPNAEMNDNRDKTWVIPLRYMRKRRIVQFPLLMALSRPYVMISGRMYFVTSKGPPPRGGLFSCNSACFFSSPFKRLNKS